MPDTDNLTLLVRMPNWLGDCVMAMPALRHLAECLPNAGIHLAGRGQFRNLFSRQSCVAGFVDAPDSGFGNLLRGLSDAPRSLRAAGLVKPPDLGILFTNSLSTAAWLRRANPKIRVGYDRDCRRFLLTHPVPCGGVERSWHFVRYYMWLAKFAESVVFDNEGMRHRQLDSLDEYLTPTLEVDQEFREQANRLLALTGVVGPYAVVAPSSAFGGVKDWPQEHYRKLIALINRELSLPVVVTGGAAHARVCQSIADDQRHAVSLAGETSLEEFAGLLAGAQLFVGGDSGGAHVAAAMGTPTLVIFGITNPSRTRPGGLRVRSLGEGRTEDVKLTTEQAREAAQKALEAISPETVLEAAREVCCLP